MARATRGSLRPAARRRRSPGDWAAGLELLQSFELRSAAGVLPLPPASQRLLAFLALHDRPLSRLYVASTLWLEANEDRAQGNLRSALWRLRPAGVVEASATHLCLHPSVQVDFRVATRAARAVLNAPAEVPVQPVELGLLTADLLVDWYDDWLLLERERFRQLRLHALERLCERYADAGRFAHAVDAGLAAVKAEPLRESAQRALIRAYLAEGNPGEAVRQYRWYRGLLHKELAVPPSVLMTRLVEGLAV